MKMELASMAQMGLFAYVMRNTKGDFANDVSMYADRILVYVACVKARVIDSSAFVLQHTQGNDVRKE